MCEVVAKQPKNNLGTTRARRESTTAVETGAWMRDCDQRGRPPDSFPIFLLLQHQGGDKSA